MNNETGWIIQRKTSDNRFVYWAGCNYDEYKWIDNPNHCVRFVRKVDAEMVIVGVLELRVPSTNVEAVMYEVKET